MADTRQAQSWKWQTKGEAGELDLRDRSKEHAQKIGKSMKKIPESLAIVLTTGVD